MRIILTHEQADFDALASLLGAHLVEDESIPVLPARTNRNVRAFINLYGVELPFIDRQDVQGSIEHVTLVDTQSMVTVKGMSSHTQVTIIDHHPIRPDLPPEWHVTIGDTGANTTLFVEEIQETNGILSILQATLLLMGIYEDTGSLTYSRTTPRDVRAAAFLLENGANLTLAVDFLNHPLSLPQQELYDDLRARAETLNIHGHHVIISCADASQMDEELSTVAHKLRDLMDPDALLLLVKTRSGVQLIARSTTDSIDVAELAGIFGGGGHSRASAALIRDQVVEDVLPRLKEAVNRIIHPAVTVAQIMSRRPQVLTPETTVEEAAARMQRFGYEGYPVVQNGKVIGLLTRRAVDRALSHKLNLKAASLMEAGEVTASPDDSIGELQRLMTDTGWGQVPVVSPDSGEIIGIVTRTDLIKTLTSDAVSSSAIRFADKLERALPPARLELLKTVAEAARELRCALYIVGGFVRDLMLDVPGQDFDLVVEGDAIALADALSKKYGGRYTHHSRFGTAKWYIGGKYGTDVHLPFSERTDLPEFLDLVSARTEFYTHPTALPTVERGSIKLDLHRRDFTINTLALRLDGRHYGELHDYWGGLNDLHQGWVRSLHSLSFVDDPTRMLRAVRFEQRFNFTIEPRTLELMKEALPLIDRVSGDRIRHELDHIFDEPQAAQMIARMDELGVLAAIHRALAWDPWFREHLELIKKFEPAPEWKLVESAGIYGDAKWSNSLVQRMLAYVVWLIRLSEDTAVQVLNRLKAPRSLENESRAAIQVYADLATIERMKPSELVLRLDEVSPLAVLAVYLAAYDPERCRLLEHYMQTQRNLFPVTTGDDLREMGLPPGPRYKEILWRLRSAWLDGEISSVEQEKELLRQLMAESIW